MNVFDVLQEASGAPLDPRLVARLTTLGLEGNLLPLRGKATPEQLDAAEQRRITHLMNYVIEVNKHAFRLASGRTEQFTEQQIQDVAAALMGEDRVRWWRKVAKGFLFDTYRDYGQRAAFKHRNPQYSIQLHATDMFGPFTGKDRKEAEDMMVLGLK